jgi:RNA polymerase sigma factor (sigma-70 family)
MLGSRPPVRRARFATTQWSLVVAAGAETGSRGRRALSDLCEAYWYPLYAYVRRSGHDVADAQDLTQAFFVRLLEGDDLGSVAKERGRFRSFLLAAMKHFLLNQARARRALKRGGGAAFAIEFDEAERQYSREPASHMTPETAFDHRWALTVLDRVLRRLRRGAVAAGRLAEFNALKPALSGELAHGSYREVGAALGMTEGAVKVAVHRLRKRFQRLLHDDIAATVEAKADVDDEIRYLIGALGRKPL